MKRRIFSVVCTLLGLALLAGCWFNGEVSTDDETNPTSESGQPDKEANHENNSSGNEAEDAVTQRINQMSLEDKLAQMLYVGINGLSLSEREQAMISEGHPGGIILLGRNVESDEQLHNLTASIKEANQNYPIPLFLGVDEEGGRVSRIPDTIKNLPASADLGQLNNPDLSYETGKLLAEKVKLFGFNMNFAPVLDINNNPNNQVIGDRSFGTTPEQVTKLGVATMKGIQSENVVPVVKHFPGHGDTSVDSHIDLPTIDKPLKQVNDFEWVPFQTAINQGADAVMTGHILFSAIDQNYPASLSKTIITDILRKRLGFDGLVITDDMTMGAISENYGTSEAVNLSIQAGTDMLLMTSTAPETFQQMKSSLAQAVNSETIPMAQIDESVRRILQTKEKYKLSNGASQPLRDMEELNDDISQILKQTN